MARTSHGTLIASTVRTVTLDAYTSQITIVNRSQSGEIYFTVDGTTPVAGAAGTYVCLGARVVPAVSIVSTPVVQLISTQALDYSIEGESS